MLLAEEVCYVRADYGLVRHVQPRLADGTPAPLRETAAFQRVRILAGLIIFLYAGLLPSIFFIVLLRERHNLREERETPATRALSFLHRPYLPQFWYFELVEMGRKILIVGVAVFWRPGSLVQLIWALIVAISVIAIEVQVAPFRYAADSYCSLVASLATIFVLLMCTVLRTGSIVAELQQTDFIPSSFYDFLEFDLWQT